MPPSISLLRRCMTFMFGWPTVHSRLAAHQLEPLDVVHLDVVASSMDPHPAMPMRTPSKGNRCRRITFDRIYPIRTQHFHSNAAAMLSECLSTCSEAGGPARHLFIRRFLAENSMPSFRLVVIVDAVADVPLKATCVRRPHFCVLDKTTRRHVAFARPTRRPFSPVAAAVDSLKS